MPYFKLFLERTERDLDLLKTSLINFEIFSVFKPKDSNLKVYRSIFEGPADQIRKKMS